MAKEPNRSLYSRMIGALQRHIDGLPTAAETEEERRQEEINRQNALMLKKIRKEQSKK